MLSSALLPLTHPASHGAIAITYSTGSGHINEAHIEIGFMHRGAEKLFEVRDYRQGAMLANRHIWSSPSAGEYAFVLAAEELLGMQPSPRAAALRAVFCEIDRIISHLTFLQAFPDANPLPAREDWANFMEFATGARMHHQVIRIGGVSFGLDLNHESRIQELMAATVAQLDQYEVPLAYQGLGLLTPEVARQHGVSGPIARAAGISWDERILGYGWYRDFEPVVSTGGDIPSRIAVLIEEVKASINLIKAAMESALGAGELLIRTPKTIRLPEGTATSWVEGALGSNGVSLFSMGARTPDRVRLRTASLGNLSALEQAIVGLPEDLLAPMLASWPFLAGDSDR